MIPTPFRPEEARGIDLDSSKHLPLFKAMYNAKAMGKTGVKAFRSPSGRGYHVICDEGFTMKEARILGDCEGRRKYWKAQGYTFTFMFRHSDSGRIVGVEREYDPLGEPFWRLPR